MSTSSLTVTAEASLLIRLSRLSSGMHAYEGPLPLTLLYQDDRRGQLEAATLLSLAAKDDIDVEAADDITHGPRTKIAVLFVTRTLIYTTVLVDFKCTSVGEVDAASRGIDRRRAGKTFRGIQARPGVITTLYGKTCCNSKGCLHVWDPSQPSCDFSLPSCPLADGFPIRCPVAHRRLANPTSIETASWCPRLSMMPVVLKVHRRVCPSDGQPGMGFDLTSATKIRLRSDRDLHTLLLSSLSKMTTRRPHLWMLPALILAGAIARAYTHLEFRISHVPSIFAPIGLHPEDLVKPRRLLPFPAMSKLELVFLEDSSRARRGRLPQMQIDTATNTAAARISLLIDAKGNECNKSDEELDLYELDDLPLLDGVCQEALPLFASVTFVWRQMYEDAVVFLQFSIVNPGRVAGAGELLITKRTPVYVGMSAANKSAPI
uniref:Uncharacterized protein n=1 Tax=Schizophyllum commune (strain H4-8 / FGSC 9210) TaxID=578458 RepID=D8Q5W4_SCHCM